MRDCATLTGTIPHDSSGIPVPREVGTGHGVIDPGPQQLPDGLGLAARYLIQVDSQNHVPERDRIVRGERVRN